MKEADGLASWFCLGQLAASIALNELNQMKPYDFRTAIYTQVCPSSISSIGVFFPGLIK